MEEQENQFLTVLEAHKGILYKVANAYQQNHEERADLIQEMTLQLWKSFKNYNGSAQYSTWIYRIVLNVAISYYRREQTRKKHVTTKPVDFMHYIAEDTNIDQEMNQRMAVLNNCIRAFKPIDRALVLLFLDDKPQAEIAQVMGISVTNVSTRLYRIRQKLSKAFQNE